MQEAPIVYVGRLTTPRPPVGVAVVQSSADGPSPSPASVANSGGPKTSNEQGGTGAPTQAWWMELAGFTGTSARLPIHVLKERAASYFMLSLLLVLLGAACIVVPIFSAQGFVIILGILMLVAAALQGYIFARACHEGRGISACGDMLCGLLELAFGIALLAEWQWGVSKVHTLCGVYLLVRGIVDLAAIGTIKEGKGRALVIGVSVVSLVTGFLLLVLAVAYNSTWVVGLCVGIHLLLQSFNFSLLARSYDRLARLQAAEESREAIYIGRV